MMSEKYTQNPIDQSIPFPALDQSSSEGLFDEAEKSLGEGEVMAKKARANLRRARVYESVGKTEDAGVYYLLAMHEFVTAASLAEDGFYEDFGSKDYLALSEIQVWLATWDGLPPYQDNVLEHAPECCDKTPDRRKNLAEVAEANVDKAQELASEEADGQLPETTLIAIDTARARMHTRQALFNIRHQEGIAAKKDLSQASADILDAKEQIQLMGARKFGHPVLLLHVKKQEAQLQNLTEEQNAVAA
jgi:hypothetical protein